MTSRTRTVLARTWCLMVLAASLAGAQENPLDGEWVLELRHALWHEGRPDQGRTLTLKLRCDAGQWQPLVMGHAREYNHGDHYGLLEQAAVEGDRVRVSVKMRIEADPWTDSGGVAEYAVRLKRRDGPDGKAELVEFEGEWEGKFRGEASKGAANANCTHLEKAKDFVPPAPGEHPRLLIRQSQIPALRAKARTEWGRRALERLKAQDPSKASMAAGQGLLYVLTQDKSCADEARRLIEACIAEGGGYWAGTVHDPGVKATELAIAFDLIYDACDEPFRARMRKFFLDLLPYWYRGGDVPLFNPSDGSNWSAMYRCGVGMGALSLVGEKTDYPPQPAKPEILELAAPADLKIGKDVPVVKIGDGRIWPVWLLAGPFAVPAEQDALASLGGAPNARPENGTKVLCQTQGPAGEIECTFAPVDPQHYFTKEYADRFRQSGAASLLDGAVDVTTATKRVFLANSYLYAVLENDRAGCYRVEMSRTKYVHGPYLWIAGRAVSHGDVVRLGPGRFPVMARVRPIPVDGWTKVGFGLRLSRAPEDAAASWLKKRTGEHEVELAIWLSGLERHRQDGGFNPIAERWLGVARQRIENWAYNALGEHGWNAEGEGYTQHSYRLVLPFAHCYRNVIGRDLVTRSNLRMALPLYTARTIFGQGGARMQSFAPGGGPLGVDNYARGFSLVPERYRPAVLWSWDRTQALADAGKLKGIEEPVDRLDPLSAAFLFVNYPVELKEQNPSEVLSRVTVEKLRGGYVFRNRWQDENDCVATLFLDSNFAGGGWNSFEAGDFRISGLGVDWTVRGQGWGNGAASRTAANVRQDQNVLLLAVPGEESSQGWYGSSKQASATFFEPRPDGSGVLTMDLSDIYTARKPGPKSEAKEAPVRKGLRAFAADYSGVSGAPGLFVVADQVTGTTGESVWQLVTEKAHTVTVTGNVFTIKAANGATLQGTVVAPAGATIKTENKSLRHEINYHGKHSQRDYPRTIVQVPGRDFFLVVMTIQKDAPPATQIEGQGPEAKVTVGRRKVCFDGKKVVLSE